jgi:putative endonuclease
MYVGCTIDLKKRFRMHNDGIVTSTKNRRPFQLIYYEAFIDKNDAYAREKYLKTGGGRNQLKKILKNSLNLGG